MTQRPFLMAVASGVVALLGATSAFSAVTSQDLVAPIAAYKTYVLQNSNKLVTDTKELVTAIKAGDIEKAKSLYPTTRISYERIEPIAELIGDLDGAIDSRADAHEQAEQSPSFGGFHRIEYGLWVEKNTNNLGPIADKLFSDVTELEKQLTTLTFPPEKVVGGAAALIEEVAATKISGEENRYSHTDLYDFQANFEGAYKIVDLLRPLLSKQHKTFLTKTETNFNAVFNKLNHYRTTNGTFENYEKLTTRDRQILAGRVNTLAEDLSKMRGMLGLN